MGKEGAKLDPAYLSKQVLEIFYLNNRRKGTGCAKYDLQIPAQTYIYRTVFQNNEHFRRKRGL